jgi:probable F420-dependent oxidoreductase
VKFGIVVWPPRPKLMIPLARKADDIGFESVWAGEHVVFPTHSDSPHPSAKAGAPLPSTPLYDPLVLYAHVAAITRRINLGTSVYVLPLRHPLNIARMIVTLDALSNGRFLFGVGVGWAREEMEALDVDFPNRGRCTDEILTILKRLWTEPRIAHSGEFYRFPEIGFEPKPVNGTIPLLVGGEVDLALKRAAKFGDGWIGVQMPVERARPIVEKLRRFRAETDKAAVPLEISVGCEQLPTPELVQRYADAGVHRLLILQDFFAPAERRIEATTDGMERFANDVVAKLQ